MGGAAVALAIKVTADAKQARAELGQATQTTSKLGQAGKVAGRLLAAGLLVAAGAAVKATQAAAEDEAAQVKLASALKNATGARAADVAKVEDWIAAQGKALGVADDQLRPALESLVTATKDVGQAQKLATIAMDISARKGVSLESVSKSLAKAQATGNVAALAKYGVATKDAAGKALSLEQVQKNLANTYKGAASAAAQTAAGKQARLKVAMGELQEEIGAKLLPVMLKLASAGLQVVDWISKNQTAALAIIGTLGGVLAVVKAVSIATQVWSAVTKIAAAAQAAFNLVMAANPVVLIVVAVVALAAALVALVIAYKRSETFRNIVNTAFGAIAKAAGAAVGFIRDHWKLIVSIIGGPIGIAVALVATHWDKIKAGAVAVIDWVKGKWPLIKEVVTAPFKAARTIVSEVWDKITSTISSAKDTITSAASGIRDGVVGAFNAIRDAIQNVIDKVQGLINKITSIPKPDLPDIPNPFGRIAGRTLTGKGALLVAGQQQTRTGDMHVHVHLDGHTFVGDEMALARVIKGVLADDRARLYGAFA